MAGRSRDGGPANLCRNIESPVGTPKVKKNANGSVTVQFAKPNSERIRNVVLLQREDGIWEVLKKY